MPLLIMLVCSLFLLPLKPGYALELTGGDHGKTFTVTSDEQVTVKLEGNPSTGYLWELRSYDQGLLTLKGEADFIRDADRPGAGGNFVFRFTPRHTGQTGLKLAYLRPWEKNVKPVRDFEVLLKIVNAADADNR